MARKSKIQKLIQDIRVVRPPRHRLSTFGSTEIKYILVTNLPGMPDRSRIRRGLVRAEKPAIITPKGLQQQFAGFGPEAEKYADWLVSQYGEALRGLEYQFQNELQSTQVEYSPPNDLIAELTRDFDRKENLRETLIQGSDNVWELSIMKFILEETLASFQSNVQELNERGFFDGPGRINQNRRREVEALLKKARRDRSLIPELGQKLKQYNLFDQYQDQFFKLVR